MAKLSDLVDTDYLPQPGPIPADIPRVYVGTGNASVEQPIEYPSAISSKIDKVLNSLFRDDDKRYQLWPEKIIREGLTGAGDVMEHGTNLGLRREDVTDKPIPNVPTQDSTWLGKQLGIAPVYNTPQDSLIEKAQAISALAGTGGLGGTDKAAGMALGVVPVDIAKKLKFETGKPNDILKKAVDNTPNAYIDPDGHLVVGVSRRQSPDQEMAESVRGGVFYLPEGAKGYSYTGKNGYGGSQKIDGETAFKNPLVVKGATGGKAPERAYNELIGDKNAYQNMRREAIQAQSMGVAKRNTEAEVYSFLEKYAPEMADYTSYIIQNSKYGNQLPYALQEAAVASAARKAGHDGVIGYSTKKNGSPFLSEVFDVRENRYPSPSGDYSVHPELYSDSKVGAGVQAVGRSGPFLRPALKHNGRLYKGKVGQEHQDIIPDALYGDFQKKAMSGEDISHYNFGFVNDKGHFLDREAALKYGIDTGLIDPQAGKFGALTSTLMADSSKPGTAIEAMAKTAEPFFSALEHNVKNIKQEKMNGDAWLGTLSNKPGVKPEELQWTGLQDFLLENKGKPVTKAQIEEHLAANKVELKEVSKGKGSIPSGWKVEERDGLFRLLDRKGEQITARSTREALDKFVEENGIYPNGATKFHSSDLSLPGGENYREMLLTLPPGKEVWDQNLIYYMRKYPQVTNEIKTIEDVALAQKHNPAFRETSKGLSPEEVLATAEASKKPASGPYKSSHWDEPNILAHVRMNDRIMPVDTHYKVESLGKDFKTREDAYAARDEAGLAGKSKVTEHQDKKSLHLEEIQSDWHQQGRDKGYKPSETELKQLNEDYAAALKERQKYDFNSDEYRAGTKKAEELGKKLRDARDLSGSVPDAPFKKSWHELALKRMIREAAEKGYDRLSWTPGEAQAARYDLSKQVDKIAVPMVNENGTRSVRIDSKTDTPFKLMVDKEGKVTGAGGASDQFSGKPLSDVVGKEMAEKIMKLDKPNEFSGDGLKIGGEGMKGFYDQIIPKALEKLGKEHGVKVKQVNLHDAPVYETKNPILNKDGKEIVSVYKDGKFMADMEKSEAAHYIKTKSSDKPATAHYIDIPQSMRDAAMNKGFPLFSSTHMFTPVDHEPEFKKKSK